MFDIVICGHSPAPLTALNRESARRGPLGVDGGGTETWASFADYLGVIERMGTSENLAWFVGHNTLRAAVGIAGEKVDENQMREMERLLQESMDTGAMGLSTGLEFEPGRWATTDEIVRLAQVVGEFDGYYASHIRNRAKFLQPAIDEFMDIVKRSGTRGQVSHLNVRYNTGAPEGAWERAVETLERERAAGLDVAADCTPLQDGLGGPAAILPPWITEDGPVWVREKGVLRLEEAIRKMTSMPATRFGLRDRGLLRPGAFADVVVFDYEALDDGSTLEQPLAYCRGVEHVLVNGTPVVDGGEHTGARPGRNLRYG